MAPAAKIDLSCALIQIENVSKNFKTPAGDFLALKDINLCFGQGEYASIMGKSGSGKSTLINMITGIDHPTTGSVRVADHDVHHMNESQLADWRGRNLGIVFQFPAPAYAQRAGKHHAADGFLQPVRPCGA